MSTARQLGRVLAAAVADLDLLMSPAERAQVKALAEGARACPQGFPAFALLREVGADEFGLVRDAVAHVAATPSDAGRVARRLLPVFEIEDEGPHGRPASETVTMRELGPPSGGGSPGGEQVGADAPAASRRPPAARVRDVAQFSEPLKRRLRSLASHVDDEVWEWLCATAKEIDGDRADGDPRRRQQLDFALAVLEGRAAGPPEPMTVAEAREHFGGHFLACGEHIDELLAFVADERAAFERGEPPSGVVVVLNSREPGTGKSAAARLLVEATRRPRALINCATVSRIYDYKGCDIGYAQPTEGRLGTVARLGAYAAVHCDQIDMHQHDPGEPELALLQAMDPLQNHEYHLDLLPPCITADFGRTLWVSTSNYLERLPDPLLDRATVIEFPGYEPEQKRRILVDFTIPAALEKSGRAADRVAFDTEAVEALVARHSSSGGMRGLERDVGRLLRRTRTVGGEAPPEVVVTAADVRELDRRPRPRVQGRGEPRPSSPGVVCLPVQDAAGRWLLADVEAVPAAAGVVVSGPFAPAAAEEAAVAAEATLRLIARSGPAEMPRGVRVHLLAPAGLDARAPWVGAAVAVAVASALRKAAPAADVLPLAQVGLSGTLRRIDVDAGVLAALTEAGGWTTVAAGPGDIDVPSGVELRRASHLAELLFFCDLPVEKAPECPAGLEAPGPYL